MPLAFKRVEESSIFLVEASQILRRDPFSPEARKKLIDGARGTYDKILVLTKYLIILIMGSIHFTILKLNVTNRQFNLIKYYNRE